MADKVNAAFEGTSQDIITLLNKAQRQAELSGKNIQEALAGGLRQEVISSYVKATGAIGTLASSITQLKNIGNIWNNDDLSAGEKVLQTLTALGTVIPMAVAGYNQLKSSMINLTVQKQMYAEASAKVAVVESQEAVSSERVAASNAQKIITYTASAAATEKQRIAIDKLIAADQKGLETY